MRTLVVTHYFPPEIGAPQARLSELAATWASDDDQVTVLTGMPNHPTGGLPPEYRAEIRLRERRDGYEGVRTWLFATANVSVASSNVGLLFVEVISVMLGVTISGRADTVVVSSPPFF